MTRCESSHGQSRFLEPHRLLHQRAVNQLAESVLSYLGLDDILLRGGARRGVEPDPLQRDPTQPLPQVGQGLDLGRSDRHLRHDGFLAVLDTSMNLTIILTPSGGLSKAGRCEGQSPAGSQRDASPGERVGFDAGSVALRHRSARGRKWVRTQLRVQTLCGKNSVVPLSPVAFPVENRQSASRTASQSPSPWRFS